MTFINLRKEVESYLDLRSSKISSLIKKYTNDSILEFCRMRDWAKIKVVEDITLDDSGSYTLDSANLANNFLSEITLMTTAGVEYDKYDYEIYLALESKAYSYAIQGETIYIDGDTTALKFIMTTTGTFANYPITTVESTQEPVVLQYYSDIIEQMVIVKLLEYSEDEQLNQERSKLSEKLEMLRRSEARASNAGRIHTARR